MIGTEFLNGQGLGNQLFCYVSSRCIAIDNGCEFGTAGQDIFANNIHSNKGMYFMDIDLGEVLDQTDEKYNRIYEKEERILLPTNKHDQTLGCYVAGTDENLLRGVSDNTIIYGNLQAEDYFLKYKDEIKKWLKIKPEFVDLKFSKDNLCILNMRGGEYRGNEDLYLRKKYWLDAMNYMRHLIPDMQFIIITEDVKAAEEMFPNLKAHHLGMGEDYVALHFAKYLILSNSSFAFWPVFTSDNAEFVIAPKYWARHNCSNGYWASEQNIYTGWNYMDRKGRVYTAEECRVELNEFKKRKWRKLNNTKHDFIWKIHVAFYNIKKFICITIKRIRKKIIVNS